MAEIIYCQKILLCTTNQSLCLCSETNNYEICTTVSGGVVVYTLPSISCLVPYHSVTMCFHSVAILSTVVWSSEVSINTLVTHFTTACSTLLNEIQATSLPNICTVGLSTRMLSLLFGVSVKI